MNPAQLLAHFETISEAPDAIAHLRRFILDLAVRGRLVAQSSAEKLAVTTFAHTIARSTAPYSLPASWRWIRIGDQLELLNGMAFKPTDWIPNGLRIVRIQNLNNPDASYNFCSPGMARERSIIDDGAFLISWSGTPGTSFGAFIWDRGRAVLNQHIFRCDFKTDLFAPPYLRLAINGRLDEMIAKAHGGVGLQHITKGKLEGLLIALPPLAEQHRIVARIDELMALCDQLEAQRAERETRRDRLAAAGLARLSASDSDTFEDDARFALKALPALTARPDQIKQLRRMIVSLAMRGKLVPQDSRDEPASDLLARTLKEITQYSTSNRIGQTFPEPVSSGDLLFDPPPGWSWTRLCALFRVITDGDHQPPPKADKGVAFLTIGNVTTGSLNFNDCRLVPIEYFRSLASCRTPVKGDILYTVVGATYGRPALVETEREFCVQRHIAILKPAKTMNLRFLAKLLASQLVYDQASKGTTGSAQPTIALRPLRNFVVPVPPLAEQNRIVAKVDQLMALCDRLETSLVAGEQSRSCLLTALLSEALRPTEQRDEAA